MSAVTPSGLGDASRFCLSCRYCLNGVEEACPECGRAFCSADPSTWSAQPSPSITSRALEAWPILGFSAVWGSLVVVPFAWPWLFLGVLAACLCHRRWVWAGIVFFISPFMITVVMAMSDYHRGELRGMRSGPLPADMHYKSMDPVTRSPAPYSGCLIYGGEWAFDLTRQGVGVSMHTMFGPSSNAYHGPYPDRAAAEQALQQPVPVDWEDLDNDTVPLSTGVVTLDQGQGHALLRGTLNYRLGIWPNPNPSPRAAMIGTDCLVLAVPGFEIQYAGQPRQIHEAIFLIDTQRGQAFAAYCDDPNALDRMTIRWGF